MQKTINAIIRSSQNPEKVSLTVKSIVALAVLVGVDVSIANTAGNELVTFIMALGVLISSATFLFGLGRKIVIGRWS